MKRSFHTPKLESHHLMQFSAITRIPHSFFFFFLEGVLLVGCQYSLRPIDRTNGDVGSCLFHGHWWMQTASARIWTSKSHDSLYLAFSLFQWDGRKTVSGHLFFFLFCFVFSEVKCNSPKSEWPSTSMDVNHIEKVFAVICGNHCMTAHKEIEIWKSFCCMILKEKVMMHHVATTLVPCVYVCVTDKEEQNDVTASQELVNHSSLQV